jgi:WD40 repeat protein
MVFELAVDWSTALQALPRDRPAARLLSLLEEAVRADVHFLKRHPGCLFQCLWNRGWWYDSPQAAKYHDGARKAVAGPRLSALLEGWRAAKEGSTPGFRWLRSLRPPPFPLGSAQRLVLGGHRERVWWVAYFPDGKRLVSVSGHHKGALHIWDTASGVELFRQEFPRLLDLVVISADGKRLAFWDGAVRVWDAECRELFRLSEGIETGKFRTAPSGNFLAFSPDGTRLASSVNGEAVQVWDATTGALLFWIRPPAEPKGLVFTPDGEFLFGACSDGIRLWDAATGEELRCWRGHTNRVNCVALSPDGRRLASGANDDTVRLWDAVSGDELRCFGDGPGFGVRCVAFSPDGRLLAADGRRGTVRIWDLEGGMAEWRLAGHESWVHCVAFSPDGRCIASGADDRTVRIFDVRGDVESVTVRGNEGHVVVASFSQDGTLALGYCLDETVRSWDARTGVYLGVTGQKTKFVPIPYSHGRWFPLRPVRHHLETVFETATDRRAVGWLPVTLDRIEKHPHERIWAGTADARLYLVAQEGATADLPEAAAEEEGEREPRNFCQECGAAIPGGAREVPCPQCGARLEYPDVTAGSCSTCDLVMPSVWRFCIRCGSPYITTW